MLKVYCVFAEGYRHEHAELVFATSGSEAKKLAWKRPHGDFCCDWIDLRVNRMKDQDYLAEGKTAPFVCHDAATLRAAGWRGDDFSSCDSCGLADFSDGGNRDWAVCSECGQCGECGHDDCCVSF